MDRAFWVTRGNADDSVRIWMDTKRPILKHGLWIGEQWISMTVEQFRNVFGDPPAHRNAWLMRFDSTIVESFKCVE